MTVYEWSRVIIALGHAILAAVMMIVTLIIFRYSKSVDKQKLKRKEQLEAVREQHLLKKLEKRLKKKHLLEASTAKKTKKKRKKRKK